MLTVKLVNDGTGNETIGNYDVTVRANDEVLWTGRVEGHDRRMGWLELLDCLVATVYQERIGEADDV